MLTWMPQRFNTPIEHPQDLQQITINIFSLPVFQLIQL